MGYRPVRIVCWVKAAVWRSWQLSEKFVWRLCKDAAPQTLKHRLDKLSKSVHDLSVPARGNKTCGEGVG